MREYSTLAAFSLCASPVWRSAARVRCASALVTSPPGPAILPVGSPTLPLPPLLASCPSSAPASARRARFPSPPRPPFARVLIPRHRRWRLMAGLPRVKPVGPLKRFLFFFRELPHEL